VHTTATLLKVTPLSAPPWGIRQRAGQHRRLDERRRPAAGRLQSGDVLVAVNGVLLVSRRQAPNGL
jgi:hypothetical protein